MPRGRPTTSGLTKTGLGHQVQKKSVVTPFFTQKATEGLDPFIENPSKVSRMMEGVETWGSYYREYPEVFCEEHLGISLRPFQKVLLYSMMKNNYSMFLASRGLGKTFLTALYCVVRCILYPGTKIVVASGG